MDDNLIPKFVEYFTNSDDLPDFDSMDRNTRTDALIAYLLVSSKKDAESSMFILRTLDIELKSNALSDSEITRLKLEIKKAQNLLKERQIPIIQNNVFNNNNVIANPNQNSKELKKWYSKAWDIWNSPFFMRIQTLLTIAILSIILNSVWGQKASIDYLMKQFNVPKPPVSTLNRTSLDLKDSDVSGGYTGSRTH